MKNKLCIILSSEYSPGTENYVRWNHEVATDLATIRTTLHHHDFIEIKIPAIGGIQAVNKAVKEALETMRKQYPQCHIVLNTHGASGKNDLKDEAVQMVIRDLSQKNTEITQISALLCNGMSGLSTTEVSEAEAMKYRRASPEFKKLAAKPASMQILQQKLNSMTTDKAQNFKIQGFCGPYDPEEDKDDIVDLLLGKSTEILEVSIKPHFVLSPSQEAENLSISIHLVQEYKDSGRTPDKKYDTATNVLGAALTKMKSNISAFLKQDYILDAEYWPLLDALEHYVAHNHKNPKAVPDKLNAHNFDAVYQRWLKENKVFSTARITVIEAYAQAIRDKSEPAVQEEEVSATSDSKTDFREITQLNEEDEFNSSNLHEGSTDEESSSDKSSSKESNSPPTNRAFRR